MVNSYTQRGTSGTSSPKMGITVWPPNVSCAVTGSVEAVKDELKGRFWSVVSIH